MNRVLLEGSFFRVLFDTIPLITLVLDPDLRVFTVNRTTANFFNMKEDIVIATEGGNVLHCIHRYDDPQGCGYGAECNNCIVRNTAIQAKHGNRIQRAKGKIDIQREDTIYVMSVLVSAAPFVYKDEQLVVVIMEDVSQVTELQGLIPICASCKNIRDDFGYWSRVEKYIEQKSEVEFTHDLCPDCIDTLYPQQGKKILNR